MAESTAEEERNGKQSRAVDEIYIGRCLSQRLEKPRRSGGTRVSLLYGNPNPVGDLTS